MLILQSWGVGCLAKVDKAQLLRNKNILINDMKAVYEQQRFDPKKLPKKQLQPLLSGTDAVPETEWMTSQQWIDDASIDKIRL